MSEATDPWPRLWHVLFLEWSKASWWDVFNKEGFQHVALLGWSEPRRLWQLADPRSEAFELTTLTVDECAALLCAWRERITAGLIVERREGPPWRTLWRPRLAAPMNCVNVAAYILRIDSGASRPWGLYRDLRKLGARPSPMIERLRDGQ